MVIVAESISTPPANPALREMFEARKRVFVDLLGWDVPVLDDRFELDQFDDRRAAYLIVADDAGRHLGSARLLPTNQPHILDSLFPELCASGPPRGGDVFEITRFCLDPRSNARGRLECRNQLVSGLVQYALQNGIRTYTGVAEISWLSQILAFGWECMPLGLPRLVDGKLLGALRIEIDRRTPGMLEANGIFRPTELDCIHLLQAA